MSRLLHFLHNQLTDGGEAVKLKSRQHLTPRKIPVTHLLEYGILIGNRTRHIPLLM
jgi:hypothetical protein